MLALRMMSSIFDKFVSSNSAVVIPVILTNDLGFAMRPKTLGKISQLTNHASCVKLVPRLENTAGMAEEFRHFLSLDTARLEFLTLVKDAIENRVYIDLTFKSSRFQMLRNVLIDNRIDCSGSLLRNV